MAEYPQQGNLTEDSTPSPCKQGPATLTCILSR